MAKRGGKLDICRVMSASSVRTPCRVDSEDASLPINNLVVAAAKPHRHLNPHRLQVEDARDGRRELV
jgi:hypothetical protein